MSIAIIIPARYESTRLPGKPLAMIAGKSMLERVYDIARNIAFQKQNIELLVATDDERILEHCNKHDINCVITSKECPSGSDRVLEAALSLDYEPEFIINLQGDAPFIPEIAVLSVIEEWQKDNTHEVITPIVNLSWQQLDTLRENKQTTPFSGTTCIINASGRALWFSKNIIPAIRKEDQLRSSLEKSPIYQHLGIYGFRTNILKRFVKLPQGHYEKLEGLEQLRLIENDIKIQTTTIDINIEKIQSGIDSPEDLKRAEALIASNQ
jgi:3-deoxy-manno-octulosonate cytidylyltransferase (CMP-KDO synthetase)